MTQRRRPSPPAWPGAGGQRARGLLALVAIARLVLILVAAGAIVAPAARAEPTRFVTALDLTPAGARPSATRASGPDAALGREAASPAGDRPGAIGFFWENDGTVLKPNNTQDRHYTNGNALTLTHHPDWAKRLNAHLPFNDDFQPEDTAAGYVLGHQMFTPRDITLKNPPRTDRPYAGYLYGGVYWQRANEDTFDHIELNLGAIGPVALGEPIQRIIHDYSGDPKPRGWDHQLGNEPTVQLFLRRKWRLPLHALWTDADRPPVMVQLLPKAELALGTVHRYIEGGVMLRAGVNLPDDFGPGEIDDLPAATGRPRRGLGVYGFVGASGRVVEHNLFLAGNTFDNSRSVDGKPLTGRVRAGVAMQYRGENWTVQGAYGQTFRSEQFETQRSGDAFGQLYLAVSRRF